MSDLPGPSLGGLRVLVVEDEMLIAGMIADTLRDAGCEIVGPALSLERGKILASGEDMDGAILDINLAGNACFPIAEILTQREVPIAFLTGYGEAALPDTYRQLPCLWKPFQLHDLLTLARRHFTKVTHYSREVPHMASQTMDVPLSGGTTSKTADQDI
jgi:DNA-binding response OmpR family regulator